MPCALLHCSICENMFLVLVDAIFVQNRLRLWSLLLPYRNMMVWLLIHEDLPDPGVDPKPKPVSTRAPHIEWYA